MWLPILGLAIGIALGLLTDIRIPEEYANYLSIAVLAAFDTLIGGIRAQLQNVYDEKIFVSGFFSTFSSPSAWLFSASISGSTCIWRPSSPSASGCSRTSPSSGES